MVAAVVYAFGSSPIHYWPFAVAWLALLAMLSFLMISTWRYYSFKGLSLSKPYGPLLIVVLGALIYGIWNWSQPVFLAMAISYVGSGIVIRIGGLLRRRFRHSPPHPPTAPEHQVG